MKRLDSKGKGKRGKDELKRSRGSTKKSKRKNKFLTKAQKKWGILVLMNRQMQKLKGPKNVTLKKTRKKRSSNRELWKN